MSVAEALKGAKVELGQTPGALQRLRLCGSYVSIIGQELLGTIKLLPYGFKALRLHSTLPHPSEVAKGKAQGVSLLKDQRYGERQRNTLDIYLPSSAATVNSSADGAAEHPVAIFCHGGVWSTGEKWHYSPLATRLAQQGIITCVLQYTLFPQALVPQMVEEVSASLTWALQNVAKHNGSSHRVTVVGHSAGAQLWLMALLHRAKQRSSSSGSAMPACFVGMAGAYDIGRHFEYEKGRGVAYLSTMARAVGGSPGFDSQSPSVLLSRAAQNTKSNRAPPRKLKENSNIELRGEPVSLAEEHSTDGLQSTARSSERQPTETAEHSELMSLDDIANLPPVFLMSSKEDITVPWEQSLGLQGALAKCGRHVDHRNYKGVGHADFGIDWQDSMSRELPNFAADLCTIIHSAGCPSTED